VIFELMAREFTLTELQRTVEAISGRHLHKQNFRRLVETAALVEPTGETSTATRGRPAALFRFRRDAVQERPAPGLPLGGRASWGVVCCRPRGGGGRRDAAPLAVGRHRQEKLSGLLFRLKAPLFGPADVDVRFKVPLDGAPCAEIFPPQRRCFCARLGGRN